MLKTFKKFCLRIIFNCLKIQSKINFDIKKDLPDKVLFISNNVSYLDSLLMYAFLPDNTVLALNGYILRKRWIKCLLKFLEADFIEFNPIDPTSLKAVIGILNKGKNVFLFPEGRLTKNGGLMKIYEAPGIIADKAEAYIVPICIDGMEYSKYFSILKGKLPLRPLPRTTITIDTPIKFDLDDNHRRDRDYLSNRILRIMIELKFKTSYKKELSIFDMLIKAAKVNRLDEFSKRIQIIEDSKRHPQTYKDLVIKSFILGNYFKTQFEHQENVGLLLPNSVATACTFFGLIAYEITPTMLNFSTGIANIISMCKTAVVKNVITSKEFITVGKMEDIVEALKSAGIKIYYLEDIGANFTLKDKIRAYLQYKRKRAPYKNSGDKKCAILFTSGSEGAPKAVVLTHSNINANITQIKSSVLVVNNKDILFNVRPMFHSFGLTVGTIFPLLTGAKVFLYPSPLHYRIIPELIYEIGATAMIATDTFFRGYSKVAYSYDFNSMRFMLGGAEAIKPENRTFWSERFGVRLLEGYGTTECSPVLMANNLVFCKFGSVGQILPGVEYKIEKIEGIEVGGMLYVKGPNVMAGYYKADKPGVLQDVTDNGWYETGDIFTVDSAGFFTIKDRVKRFAKIGGEMVSLTAVENIAEKAFAWMKTDFEYGAVAIPHESKGEQIVLATNNKMVTHEALQLYAKNNGISELFLPRNIIYKETFPVFSTGKRNNVALKKEIMEELGIEK